MSSSDKDLAGVLTKLKNANIFPVRVRLYQKLATNGIIFEPESELADELLNNLLNDITTLSHQTTASESEWEAFLKLSLMCLRHLKEKTGERFSKLLSIAPSKCSSPDVLVLLMQCCITFLRCQRNLPASLKRHILDLAMRMESSTIHSAMASQDAFSDFLVLVGMLLNENENIQVVVVGIIKSMKNLLEKFSRDQKIELLKSVDNEQFRNHIRNLSRSSSCHSLVCDVLLVFIPSCGEVLHSANLANIILAWATYLAKSLIHDAALSFYVVWTALVDNFATLNNVILSSRHRKLILSGFGPSLTNAKLRTPELMMAKIRAWWHFIVKISHADPTFLSNAETFSQLVAPLIGMASGETITFQSSPSLSVSTSLSSFQESDFGKLVLPTNGSAQNNLIALSCEILYAITLTSLGTNSSEKLETWLKNKHQVIPYNDLFIEPIAKSTSFGLDPNTLVPSLCTVVAAIFEEIAKSHSSSSNSGASADIAASESNAVASNVGTGVAHLFSVLLFWLASSVECSQDTGAPHWLQLTRFLESCSALPIDIIVMAGLNVTFVTELPSTSYINSVEFSSDEQSLTLLIRLVDLVSKCANLSAAQKNAIVPLSNASDPSLAVSCVEMALMKMLSLFRKTASSFTTEPASWRRLESVGSVVSRQNPVPPAYVIYCWVHNWQRLGELADGMLSGNPNSFDLTMFTTFLAMPFKLLRLCHVANGPTCCRIIAKTDHQSSKVQACLCSACRRLLDKEFLTTLASKWCSLFDAFCNAPDSDTPRGSGITRGSGSVIKLCTKLLKNLKPATSSPCSLPLPFLTFAALCFESIREKALAATSQSNQPTRRTSRIMNLQQQSEATSVFVRCVTAACKESAESLTAVVAFAEHIHQQCKKSCAMTTAPLGFTVCSSIKSFVNCFESLSGALSESSINEFSGVASTLVPVASGLLAAGAKVLEASEAGICCLAPVGGEDVSKTLVCDAIADGARRILVNLNRFTDVKSALLSSTKSETTKSDSEIDKDTNLSQGFSNLVTQLSNCKRSELKQLAREISRDLWPPGGNEKQPFGTEMLQACALMPESQTAAVCQPSTTSAIELPARTRGKRFSLATPMTRSSGSDQQPTGTAKTSVFGSLLTSPVKSKSQAPAAKVNSSPLFSPPARRPNTISTTGRGRASTGSSSTAIKRPSSVLGKRAATIDMEQSCDFVIVEASQDPIESAKKRKLKATDHQLEVLNERKSDIPPMFNTLDAESQASLSSAAASKDVVESSLQNGNAEAKNDEKVKPKKKNIVPCRRLCPLIARASIVVPNEANKTEPMVIEESQNEEVPHSSNKLSSPTATAALPLTDVNSIPAEEQVSSADGSSQNTVQDSSSLDLFSNDSAECSNVLQMDVTIASPSEDDDDLDGAEAAAMILLADKAEAAHESEVANDEVQPTSPDIVESSLEMTYEPSYLPSSLSSEEPAFFEQNVAILSENILCTSSPRTSQEPAPSSIVIETVPPVVPPSVSPTPPPYTDTAMEVSSTTVDKGGCESPMQQSTSAAAVAIMRAARGTPSSPGILKRPQPNSAAICASNQGGIVETPSPARKTRHVSFSAKTYVKEISPINAPSSGHESVFSSWRSSRKDRDAPGQPSTTPLMPPPPPPPKEAIASESLGTKADLKPEPATQSVVPSSSVSSRVTPIEANSSTTAPALTETTMIYPSLIACARPIGEILPQIASTQFQHGLLATLRAAGIRTIGDLAKLSGPEVRRFPFRTPQVEVLKTALADFEKRIGFQREGISRMAMMLGGRSSTGSVNVEPIVSSAIATHSTTEHVEQSRANEPALSARYSLPAQVPTTAMTASSGEKPAVVTSSLPVTEDNSSGDNRRTVITDTEGAKVDFDYVVKKSKSSSSLPVEMVDHGTQSDEYSLAMAALIDQLHTLASKTCSSNEYVVENCEFIAAYSRWCQRAIHPK